LGGDVTPEKLLFRFGAKASDATEKAKDTHTSRGEGDLLQELLGTEGRRRKDPTTFFAMNCLVKRKGDYQQHATEMGERVVVLKGTPLRPFGGEAGFMP